MPLTEVRLVNIKLITLQARWAPGLERGPPTRGGGAREGARGSSEAPCGAQHPRAPPPPPPPCPPPSPTQELKLITDRGAEGRRKLSELFQTDNRLVSSLTRPSAL